MNTRHKPIRAPWLPRTRTLHTDSVHPYQNKQFKNKNREFLSPWFSHTCAHSRPYPVCFDTLHKKTQGEGVTPVPTFPSRIGMGNASIPPQEKEGFLTSRTPFGMTSVVGEERAEGKHPRAGPRWRSDRFRPAEIDLDVEFFFEEVGGALGVAHVFGGVAAGLDL